MATISTRIIRPVLAFAAAAGLGACASVDAVSPIEPASRNIAPATTLNAPVEAPAQSVASYKVVGVTVNVPETLRVNEANRYYPGGDIVWREDPIGNRHEQVRVIIQTALEKGAARVDGDQDVIAEVSVSRFHALTEKARYTVGGVHAIQFSLRLVDAETGAVVRGPKFIKADFEALGGQAAVRAEARGVTQKVRITDHLAYVIEQELTRPQGFVEYDNGLMGAINQL
ncbi:MAG: hypothetical protein QNJ44_23230 [Rhodobacter sp.]|nr:hypothetical protein [Rhodobacter sp.]